MASVVAARPPHLRPAPVIRPVSWWATVDPVSSTTYRTGAPTHSEQAGIEALIREVRAADGVDPLNENAHFALRGERPAVHWIAPTPGSPHPRGYAQWDPETRSAIIVVDPAHRGEGVGRELLGCIRKVTPAPTLWAFGNLPSAQTFATKVGLTETRRLLIMRRDLREHPATLSVDNVVPAGVNIDTYQSDDLSALVEVNAEAFREHPEQGELTAADFEQRMGQAWFDPEGLLLAHDDDSGRLLGFHWTKVEPRDDGGEPVGEVYALAVLPDAAGRGIGRALLAAGVRHLQDRGVAEVILYVEASNTRVVDMYRSANFVTLSSDASYS